MDIDYHDLACEGRLAQDFDQWDLKNPDGWSVAHEAARTGHLPPDFTRWEILDADGWTVAHEAAMLGSLPPDFNQWDLADFDGYTVAHTAAEHGHLPPDFPHMDWVDVDGLSVGKVYAKKMNTKPAQKPKESMRTMVYDFSRVRPPKNPIDPEEVATVRRILRQYPYEVEGDRIRLHPNLKVTPEERLILRKYLMAKGYHAAKEAVAELDAVKDASPRE
ncbi:MAG: ankyrin repeat domain-containing protein [Proteobacteria bacterium]|nr:ankyrin repeat domain-containing protein [Pseudomonadota bacterium]